MEHPKNISISGYSYDLPQERIANFPLDQRDQSKLLIWKEGEIEEDIYKNIVEYLPGDSLMVFNNTKVIPARIHFQKPSGGIIEIFCLEPYEEGFDYAIVMQKRESVKWKCMIGGASKWKDGSLEKKIRIGNEEVALNATLIKKLPDAYVAELSWLPGNYSFGEVADRAGEVPLPPYIKREPEKNDRERYQTIFAKDEGSVAAPTAGLHFSEAILASLREKDIHADFVTLHVGAGTFKPVKALTMEGHEMHQEWIDVSADTIKNITDHLSQNITAVGTTTLRTLESLYWMGVKCLLNPKTETEKLMISQWEVYEPPMADTSINNTDALNALLAWLNENNKSRLLIPTQILIAPGYCFRIADQLVTNFHQPRSTLLLLVAAAAGEEWKNIYSYALANNFRFLSYGDGCLIYINKKS